jgi:hypothetical protein
MVVVGVVIVVIGVSSLEGTDDAIGGIVVETVLVGLVVTELVEVVGATRIVVEAGNAIVLVTGGDVVVGADVAGVDDVVVVVVNGGAPVVVVIDDSPQAMTPCVGYGRVNPSDEITNTVQESPT